MARSFGRTTVAVLLVCFLLGVQGVGAALDPAFEIPVKTGLAWLALQQNLDPSDPESYGSWGSFPQCDYRPDRVEMTSLAVLKMIERAHELGETPYDEDYQYHQNIIDGLSFLQSKVQGDGSIWDAYYFQGCEYEPPIIYDTSLAIMAFSAIRDTSFKPVVTQAIDEYLLPAQASHYYPFHDPEKPLYNWFGGWSNYMETESWANQKNTGFVTLALIYAQNKLEIPVPQEVVNKLTTWTEAIQAPSGGSYTEIEDMRDIEIYPLGYGWGPVTLQNTGLLLFEQRTAGLARNNPRVTNAVGYISSHWSTGSYSGAYTTMTGLDAWDVRDFNGQDWFQDLTGYVLDQQIPPEDPDGGSWADPTGWEEDHTPFTEWALLVLEGRANPAALTITKEAYPASLQGAGDVTYTFTVKNTGVSNIVDLTVTDTILPDGPSVIVAGPADWSGGDDDTFLEPQESWIYTATASLTDDTTDMATVTGYDELFRKVTATSNPLMVPVGVGEENQAPVAVNDAYATDEDVPLGIAAPGVLANDADAESDPLTAILVSGPSHGTLTLNDDGSFTYTPEADYHGADSFTYMANDGTLDSDPATVSITVIPVNDPPNVDPEPLCLWPPNHQYEVISIDVTDPDNDPLVIAIQSVTVDEPTALITGAGGKKKAPDADATINGGTVNLLRSERSGNGNGRVYVVTFTADDGTVVETGTLRVCVPHDLSAGCTCVDDGQLYDATKYN